MKNNQNINYNNNKDIKDSTVKFISWKLHLAAVPFSPEVVKGQLVFCDLLIMQESLCCHWWTPSNPWCMFAPCDVYDHTLSWMTISLHHQAAETLRGTASEGGESNAQGRKHGVFGDSRFQELSWRLYISLNLQKENSMTFNSRWSATDTYKNYGW